MNGNVLLFRRSRSRSVGCFPGLQYARPDRYGIWPPTEFEGTVWSPGCCWDQAVRAFRMDQSFLRGSNQDTALDGRRANNKIFTGFDRTRVWDDLRLRCLSSPHSSPVTLLGHVRGAGGNQPSLGGWSWWRTIPLHVLYSLIILDVVE
jgi:hypothetical protein